MQSQTSGSRVSWVGSCVPALGIPFGLLLWEQEWSPAATHSKSKARLQRGEEASFPLHVFFECFDGSTSEWDAYGCMSRSSTPQATASLTFICSGVTWRPLYIYKWETIRSHGPLKSQERERGHESQDTLSNSCLCTQRLRVQTTPSTPQMCPTRGD